MKLTNKDNDKVVHQHFKLPESLREEFHKVAAENFRSPSDLLREFMRSYIKKNSKREKE